MKTQNVFLDHAISMLLMVFVQIEFDVPRLYDIRNEKFSFFFCFLFSNSTWRPLFESNKRKF